jgi:transcriptional regulator with XRE-family HTH domain
MNLRDYLKQNGLTMQRFGDRVGCTHATIQRLAAGTRFPSHRLLMAIREATGGAVDAADFGVEPEPPEKRRASPGAARRRTPARELA